MTEQERIAEPGAATRSALALKAYHAHLAAFSDDELHRIAVLPAGSQLAPGQTYLDLHSADCHEFTAMGNTTAGPHNWYVPKAALDASTWQRLIGSCGAR